MAHPWQRPDAPLSGSLAAAQPASDVTLASEAGQAVLVHAGGVRRRLSRAGKPAALAPGWSVDGVHVALAPIIIVSLAHADGRRERWIVDAADQAQDGPLPGLPEPVRELLRRGTRRLLLDAGRGEQAARTGWDRLPRAVRLELLANARQPGQSDADSLTKLAGGWTAPPSGLVPVCCDDDLISVTRPGGVELPVIMAAVPLRPSTLARGWSADTLYCDFAPFSLLELRHESGARATWVLDQDLAHVDDVARISGAVKGQLCQCALPVIERHLQSVLAFEAPAGDPVVERYLCLNFAVRHILVAHCHALVRPAPVTIDVASVPTALPVPAGPSGAAPVLLDPDAMQHAVGLDLHRRTLEAIATGSLDWPSPVDASPTRLRGIFTLDDYVFLYQFTDRHGLDFIVVASDRCCKAIGVMIPRINVMLFDSRTSKVGPPDDWMRGELGGGFWSLLVRHLSQYGEEMAGRARSNRARPVNVLLATWRVHICHHLWNDLSGIEALCAAVPAAALPTTMVIGAPDGGAELFGPIETLFPGMNGHVDRSLADVDAFIRWTYRHDVWPTRITREYVTASLRARVDRHLAAASEARDVAARLPARARSVGRAPVVVFGLRVEDRTFVDLPGFCEAFVAHMSERYPGCTIVFDGYNSRPGTASGAVIQGMAYAIARRPPEQVEAELVATLVRQFAAAPVSIIGTTGQSIASSLAWCRHADAAFAIWGAGLTKYRWLANLPTMMISGHANMLHRYDILIYHGDKFMEASAPAIFPDASLVTDVPEHASLATGHIQRGRECFDVDTAGILSAFDVFLARTLGQGRPLEA